MRKIKARVEDLSAGLVVRGVKQPLVAGPFTYATVLLAGNERMLLGIVDESDRMCNNSKK